MSQARVLYAQHNDVYILKLVGEIRFTLCPAIDEVLQGIFTNEQTPVVVDLTETTCVDSTALGVVAQIAVRARQQGNAKPSLLIAGDDIRKILQGVSFDRVFNVLQKTPETSSHYQELQPIEASEQELLEKVLQAHKNLCELSGENSSKFKDVISLLEKP